MPRVCCRAEVAHLRCPTLLLSASRPRRRYCIGPYRTYLGLYRPSSTISVLGRSVVAAGWICCRGVHQRFDESQAREWPYGAGWLLCRSESVRRLVGKRRHVPVGAHGGQFYTATIARSRRLHRSLSTALLVAKKGGLIQTRPPSSPDRLGMPIPPVRARPSPVVPHPPRSPSLHLLGLPLATPPGSLLGSIPQFRWRLQGFW